MLLSSVLCRIEFCFLAICQLPGKFNLFDLYLLLVIEPELY